MIMANEAPLFSIYRSCDEDEGTFEEHRHDIG